MNDLKKLLMDHEGIRLRPYRDTVGKLTIGVGRNLDDNGITLEEAMYLLDHDIEIAKNEAEKLPWFNTLSENRQTVIICMIFNMGLPRVLEFKNMIRCLEKSDFKGASVAMLYSKWATQVGKRAKYLAQLMIDG